MSDPRRQIARPAPAAAKPRRLVVSHVSTYRYSEPVHFGEHRMMFRPRSSHDIRLLDAELRITPVPRQLRWLHDVFDNSVAAATFSTKAKELVFDSRLTLDHFEMPPPDEALDPDAVSYPFAYEDEEAADLVQARIRRYPVDPVDAWARRFLGPRGTTDTLALLCTMTLAIKDEFTYRRRVEKGVNAPADTLRSRSGSCRDFTILMIEAVRSLGFAARFVSGYILGGEPDAEPDAAAGATLGGGATHAWLQVYLPGAGWVDFDPTNGIIGNRHLIRVAVAWDHRQALPLWGSWYGESASFRGLEVQVNVTELTHAHSREGSTR